MGGSDHAQWHKVRKAAGSRLDRIQSMSWKQKGRDRRFGRSQGAPCHVAVIRGF